MNGKFHDKNNVLETLPYALTFFGKFLEFQSYISLL